MSRQLWSAVTHDIETGERCYWGPFTSHDEAVLEAEAESVCSGMVEGGSRVLYYKAVELPVEVV